MKVETTTKEADTETRLHRAFERLIEIKYQRTLLDAEKLLKIKQLEEHLSQAREARVIIHQAPYIVGRIIQS